MLLMAEVEELKKTPRREAREGYIRFLLTKSGINQESIEAYLNEKQAVLENRSLLEMVYTGDYRRAVSLVESFIEEMETE